MEGSSDEIAALLERVTYPTTKPDLIAAAAGRGLPVEVLERIERLPGGHYLNADEVGRELVKSRASSNPGLVAITAEACDTCGFPRRAGEPHSCVEEKALFAESANAVTDEFETLDGERA